MNFFPLFESQLPQGATTGIAFSGVAIGGAIIVFILLRISSYLKNSGGLTLDLKVMNDLRYSELRLEAKFFNSTRKDFKYSEFAIYQKQNHQLVEVSKLSDAPIETGGRGGRWDYGSSSLSVPPEASYFGIFVFVGEGLSKGSYYLGFKDDKGKIAYHPFNR